MKKVSRDEILPLDQYEKVRDIFRAEVMREKDPRRIHVGEHLTFLFENHATILYQVQEMIRAEKMSKDSEIQHEIETYNELIGEAGELGCTLLIEIENKEQRAHLLAEWKDLPRHLYIKTHKGTKIPAIYDERQVGETRLSSVQYLKFKIGGEIPVAIGCSHPSLTVEANLKPEQLAALCKDLH